MVIYAEYLFLENALTGGIILLLTGKLFGIKCKKSLIILGSILCGIYSFALFLDSQHPALILSLKLGFSLILVLLVFQPKELKRLGRLTMVFYLISFAMGGITIGLMYLIGIWGVTQNSFIYMGAFGYTYILSGCLLTYIMFCFFSSLIKGRLIKERTFADVEISIEGKKVTMRGMVDTGNFLRDPFTGKPVMIISAAAARQLLPDEIVESAIADVKNEILPENLMNSRYASRSRKIPYKSLGEERGYMVGIRTDAIRIGAHNKSSDTEEIVYEGTILAIYKGIFSRAQSGEDYSILIHPSMMEGGIA